MRKKIGYIGVDAGMCMIGDPCYVIDADLGKMEWAKFLDTYCPQENYPVWRVPNTRARDSKMCLAIVVGSGYGDGVYPVSVEINGDGRVTKLVVDFVSRS